MSSLFMMKFYITNLYCKKCAKTCGTCTFANVVNYILIFYIIITRLIFFNARYIEKCTVKMTHSIVHVRILIHSSF
jgi:hypothetical protein